MSWSIRIPLYVLSVVLLLSVSLLPSNAQIKRLDASSQVTHAASQPALPRTVIHTSYAGPKRYLYTYTPDGRQETERIQRIASGTWVDSLRTTWTYTAAGKLKSTYVEQYLLGAFRAMSRWSIEYNDAGDIVSDLYEQGNWILEPGSRTLNTYLAPGKIATRTSQSWSGSWSNTSRTSTFWSAEGQRTGYVDENWAGARWDTTAFTTIVYGSGTLNEETYRTRSKGDGSWRDSSYAHILFDDAQHVHFIEQKYWVNGVLGGATRTTITFDVRGWLTRSETEELVQNVMSPTQRITHTYDFSGNELEQVGDVYEAGTWGPLWKLTSTYDGSGNMLTCKAYSWASATWVAATGASPGWEQMAIGMQDAIGNWLVFSRFSTLTFTYGDGSTGDPADPTGMPHSVELSQNYPNPFNPSTTIRYALPERAQVSLTIYDALGQLVRILANGEQEAGYHHVVFDGAGLPSGMYFYRLRAGAFVESKRMLLIR